MTPSLTLDPPPFFLEGNKVGILLVHGFTGSITEMRPPPLPEPTGIHRFRTLGSEWEQVTEKSYQFIKRYSEA